ncbi:MAG: hypothetical protein V3U75_00925 [Methylococcaceae bacterium]
MTYGRPLLIACCLINIFALVGVGYLGIKFANLSSVLESLPRPVDILSADDHEQNGGDIDDFLYVWRSELTLLTSKLASLERQLDEQRADANRFKTSLEEVVKRTFANTDPGSSDQESIITSSLSDDQLEYETRQQVEERVLTVTDYFQAESMDSLWSTETLEVIENTFNSEQMTGSSLMASECRSTICRIEVEHGDVEQRESFELHLPFTLAGVLSRGTMVHNNQPDGSIRTTMYLARDGFQLSP